MPRQANKSDVERALNAAGFIFVRGRGRGGHEKWRSASGALMVMVPRHGRDIAPGTFAQIREQAGGWSSAKFWWYADGQKGPEPV